MVIEWPQRSGKPVSVIQNSQDWEEMSGAEQNVNLIVLKAAWSTDRTSTKAVGISTVFPNLRN